MKCYAERSGCAKMYKQSLYSRSPWYFQRDKILKPSNTAIHNIRRLNYSLLGSGRLGDPWGMIHLCAICKLYVTLDVGWGWRGNLVFWKVVGCFNFFLLYLLFTLRPQNQKQSKDFSPLCYHLPHRAHRWCHSWIPKTWSTLGWRT